MSPKVNKFNARWQLVRVKARKIKDVSTKINFVLDYYFNNVTVSDLNRVSNWLRMTSLGYHKDFDSKKKFFDALERVENTSPTIFDNDSTVFELSEADISMVLKDLGARDYKFRYNGKIPVNHISFVIDLKNRLSQLKGDEK